VKINYEMRFRVAASPINWITGEEKRMLEVVLMTVQRSNGDIV
jgi:hypothetical protein